MIRQFLTQIELAVRWNMSPRTLERWRWDNGGPPHIKIGGLIRYRLTDLEKFEARLAGEGMTPAQARKRSPRGRLAGSKGRLS